MQKDSNFTPRVAAVLVASGLTALPPYKLGCPICAELDDARRLDEADRIEETNRVAYRESRQAAFNSMLPEKFGQTDLLKLPANPESVTAVRLWTYAPQGLIVHGQTGRGKTRAVWTLLRRLYVEEARSLTVMDAFEFGSKTSEAYRKGDEEEWVRKLVEVQVLFLDDLGKAKITQRVGELLFTVIDRRHLKLRPTIITTNGVGDTLRARFEDQELAGPLLRRLRDIDAFLSIAF